MKYRGKKCLRRIYRFHILVLIWYSVVEGFKRTHWWKCFWGSCTVLSFLFILCLRIEDFHLYWVQLTQYDDEGEVILLEFMTLTNGGYRMEIQDIESRFWGCIWRFLVCERQDEGDQRRFIYSAVELKRMWGLGIWNGLMIATNKWW